MASWKWPAVLNKMLEDIPGINTLLNALLKQDPAGTTDVPAGAKRWTDTADGKQLQVWNGSSWSSVGKLDHDAASVDGHSASTGTKANTIPVRDKDGALPGDILGNAATASEAAALSEVNPIEMGGTGGSTAAKARENLVVPPKNHASSSTDYGLGTSTQYGHTKPHDKPDATLTADAGHAFSPAGAANLKTDLEGQIGDVETGASQQVSALNSTLRALIEQEVAKKLSTSGGTMGGTIFFPSGVAVAATKVDGNWGGKVQMFRNDHPSFPGALLLDTGDIQGSPGSRLMLLKDACIWKGSPVLTSAGGTITGHIKLTSNETYISKDATNKQTVIRGGTDWNTGAQIILYGKDNTSGNLVLRGTNGDKASQLVLGGKGSTTLNGSTVLTAANGLLLNSSNVKVYSNVASVTLPAGGSWVVVGYSSGTNSDAGVSGTYAGGTTVSMSDFGHVKFILALKIAA